MQFENDCATLLKEGAVVTHITTGLYKSPAAAAQGVRALERRSISHSDINLVASDDFDKDGFKDEPHSKAPEGLLIGAAGGGAMGALIAGLTAVTSIATGGASLGLLVAGPFTAAILGGSAGAFAGSIIGGMVGAAIPEKELKFYENAIREGSVLIGVKSRDAKAAETIRFALEQSGAERVSHSPSKFIKRLIENDSEAKVAV